MEYLLGIMDGEWGAVDRGEQALRQRRHHIVLISHRPLRVMNRVRIKRKRKKQRVIIGSSTRIRLLASGRVLPQLA